MAAVGGAVGGFLVLALILATPLWLLSRRRAAARMFLMRKARFESLARVHATERTLLRAAADPESPDTPAAVLDAVNNILFSANYDPVIDTTGGNLTLLGTITGAAGNITP